jgi:hypothetical protein
MAAIEGSLRQSKALPAGDGTLTAPRTAIDPMRIRSCSRLGMSANPPAGLWPFGWLRRR